MLRAASVIACLFAALHATGAAADTITIRADDWCPYTCAPNGDKPGYLIEIAREALGKAGHTVNYDFMPWSRVVLEVAAGGIDAAAGAGRGDVPTGVFSQQTLGKNTNTLALKMDRAFTYAGTASLEALRLGVTANYSYDAGELDAYIKDHIAKADGRVEPLSGTETQSSNLRKLLAGRIDAVLENENVLALAIKEIQPKPEIRLMTIGTPDDVYIAFSPKNPKSAAYAALIDEAIIRMRGDGRLKTILAGYGLTDWR